MKTFKVVAKRAFVSIAMSLFIFIAIGMYFDIKESGTFTLTDYGFTKMVLACIVSGLGFGVPTILYNSEKICDLLCGSILCRMDSG